MHQVTTFQIVVLGIFVGFILVGVGIFAAFGGLNGAGAGVGNVVIWGTYDDPTMQKILGDMRQNDGSFQNVTYVAKDSRTYDQELVNAMASGFGPDIFLISQDDIQSFTDKVVLIPFGTVSQGSFLSSYIDEGQLFLTPQGSLALPFMVDPLVMYWNHDLFANAGLANPPAYWNDLLDIAPKITSLDRGTDVKKSAVAMGTWSNIAHAKAILSALFMQAGDGIVVRSTNTGGAQLVFGANTNGNTTSPAESALRFYTEFADPSKTSYSWNRSLPEAQDSFVAGDTAVYFGLASEYGTLSQRNPNLHYSVATLPQIQGNSNVLTYGEMTALAIPRTSHNISGALTIAAKLSGKDAAAVLAQDTNLPPVRRDVTVDTSSNAAAAVFQQSAIMAQGWLDPSPQTTNGIFQEMIESVISGQNDPAAAVSGARQELLQLLPQ
jgi:ABC-type glycerol-3-phosphate transport system substrate-binding protein